MAVISNETFKSSADRLAKQVKILKDAVDSIIDKGTTHYNKIAADAIDNYDMMDGLIDSYDSTDDKFTSHSEVIKNLISDYITKTEAHVRTFGMRTLDTFLTASGIDVSSYYDDAYYWTKGSHLNAVNVFRSEDVELGSLTVSSSGIGSWSEGNTVGTGTGSYSSTNSCATNFECLVMSGIGINDIEMQLRCKNEDGTWENVNFTIPNTATGGEVIQVKVEGELQSQYIDLNTSVSHFAGGNSGDAIIFRAVILRGIGL